MRLVLDYETRSEADLKKIGAVSYAQHPSTEIICVGYKIDNDETRIWIPGKEKIPRNLVRAFNYDQPRSILAHNALFEQVISEYILRRKYTVDVRYLPPSRWRCSAAKAAACALPRNLEGALLALKAPIQKDMSGNRLMKKHMKPRPTWVKKGTGNKYFEDPEERKQIYSYCIDDVEGEDWLDRNLPDLSPFEQRVWELNQSMNLRGVRIDIDTVKRIIEWISGETSRMNIRLKKLTEGSVRTANQRDEMIRWIRSQGVAIPNLQSATVNQLVEMVIPEHVKKVLQIRQSIGKSSLKKYPAMLKRASFDKRVKDYSMYHGASTGREAGRGLQLQNLVKPKWAGFDSDLAIKFINESTLDEIRFLYGDPFEVFSGCVRGMIQASPIHKLYVADYNAIEARVLAWMANDAVTLGRYRKKIDAYVIMAAKIYGVKLENVTDAQRDIGKRAVLGCGFGMGGKKFHATCLKYGADISLELAKRAVKVYRESHPKIEAMWKNIEMAALKATRKPGLIIKVHKTSWQFKNRFLWCTLPSGRKIAYYGPTVKSEPTPWGEHAPKLYHWSSNPVSKKWENAATYGGKLTENVVQATARDICVNGMVNLQKNDFSFLFMVHDEVIAEATNGDIRKYEKILTDLPPWAEGLPLTAKGWVGERYAKR